MNQEAFEPDLTIERSLSWAPINAGEIWRFRDLLYFLVWRDVKVRYKQTALGAAWVILQPLMTTAAFTVFFGKLGGLSGKVGGTSNYAVFMFIGMIPWQFFVGSVNRGSASLVNAAAMITKVYFPRLVLPLAAVAAGLVDFSITLLCGTVLLSFTDATPSILSACFLPVAVLVMLAAALGASLWLSALNVRYRDVGQLMGFMMQLWFLATPVAYPASIIPERFRLIYGLNPMTGVLELFRWGLAGQAPDMVLVACSISVTLAVLVGGAYYFRLVERTFADVV